MSNTTITEFAVNWDILKAVSLIASRDKSRYILNGVQVEYSAEHTILVATDGRRMCCVRIEAQTQREDGACNFIIPLSLINATPQRGKKYKSVIVKYSSQTNRVKIIPYSTLISVSAKAVEGVYPRWRMVIPKKIEVPKVAPSFRPEQLSDFHKITRAMILNSEPSIRIFQGTEDGGAFVLENGSKDFFGVISPIRTESSQSQYTLPTWL